MVGLGLWKAVGNIMFQNCPSTTQHNPQCKESRVDDKYSAQNPIQRGM